MGLDITAYRKLKRVKSPEMEGEEPVNWQAECHIRESDIDLTESNFPGRTDGLAPGVYTFEDKVDVYAGSYGGYNQWRDQLARHSGYPSASAVHQAPPDEGPFVELINFSDCEGYIGASVASKLAKDFAEHQFRILAESENAYFIEKYLEWRKAFEMAADGGAVEFH